MTTLAAEVLQKGKMEEGRKEGKGDSSPLSTHPTNEKKKQKKMSRQLWQRTEGGKETKGGEWGTDLERNLN